MHVADFIEKTLHDNRLPRWHHTEAAQPCVEIVGKLGRGAGGEAEFAGEPAVGGLKAAFRKQRRQPLAQT